MGPFSIIYADPPWHFKTYTMPTADMDVPVSAHNRTKGGRVKHPAAHYKTMDSGDICTLPVRQSAAENSILAMWVYDPMLPDAFMIAEAWGFKFVTVLFRWMKTISQQNSMFGDSSLNYGTGYHTRGGGCEEFWLFKRGKGLPVLNHGIRKEFYSPLREHSRKPDEVSQWLVDLYGDVPRLEMFARTQRLGWAAFGNEVTKFSGTPSTSPSPSAGSVAPLTPVVSAATIDGLS